MEFTITAQNGDSVKVEAENWMVAIGRAMVFFQVDLLDLARLVCNAGSDGSVFIDDGKDRTWMVRPITPKITVVAAMASAPAVEPVDEEPLEEASEEAGAASTSAPPPITATPPSLLMPVQSSLHKHVEERIMLAERLFDVSMDMSLATPEEACQLAVELLGEYVPAKVISVAYGTINDAELRVLAVAGPIADAVKGSTIPFGEGLLGQCIEIGGQVLCNDLEGEGRHLDRAHEDAGYVARAALCVPIVDAEGSGYGVIQVLDPGTGTFDDDTVQHVHAVARTLGASFAEQSAG